MKQPTHIGELIAGPYGQATEVILDLPIQKKDWEACVSCWLLYCPGQSMAWDRFLFSAIHLRPIEDVKPAVINLPNASHEVILVALNPDYMPDPNDTETWHMLLPINVMEQVELPDDQAARSLMRACVVAVVHGSLPAEPALAGAIEPWHTTLIKTSAHFRGEPHAP